MRSAWTIIALSGVVALLVGCNESPGVPDHLRVIAGDPKAGQRLVAEWECGACHVIPDIKDANGHVGPPLSQFGRRLFIGGHAANRPDNLVQWIMDPPSLAPDTAMPNMGIPRDQARHIAAYLYTLR